jgi:hypothetical protein
MNNTFLKTIGTAALAFFLLVTFTQISVSAQEEENIINEENRGEQTLVEDLNARSMNARALVGVWNLQVTGRNCQTGEVIRTFPSMFTIHRGGTMNEWGTSIAPSTRGLGQGVWSYESEGQYTSAFQFFRFNADGILVGKLVTRQQIQLSRSGDSFTSAATSQVLDVNGNVISTGCSTGIAARFE